MLLSSISPSLFPSFPRHPLSLPFLHRPAIALHDTLPLRWICIPLYAESHLRLPTHTSSSHSIWMVYTHEVVHTPRSNAENVKLPCPSPQCPLLHPVSPASSTSSSYSSSSPRAVDVAAIAATPLGDPAESVETAMLTAAYLSHCSHTLSLPHLWISNPLLSHPKPELQLFRSKMRRTLPPPLFAECCDCIC